MLMKLDKFFGHYPSEGINFLTDGIYGASLCGRLYLYRRYITHDSYLVNFLIFLIDHVENHHCHYSAKLWRARVRKHKMRFPAVYTHYFNEPTTKNYPTVTRSPAARRCGVS